MPVISSSNTIKGTYGLLRLAGVPSGTSFVGAEKGAQLVNTLTGIHYTNTGTAASPTWTVTGTQS